MRKVCVIDFRFRRERRFPYSPVLRSGLWSRLSKVPTQGKEIERTRRDEYHQRRRPQSSFAGSYEFHLKEKPPTREIPTANGTMNILVVRTEAHRGPWSQTSENTGTPSLARLC